MNRDGFKAINPNKAEMHEAEAWLHHVHEKQRNKELGNSRMRHDALNVNGFVCLA